MQHSNNSIATSSDSSTRDPSRIDLAEIQRFGACVGNEDPRWLDDDPSLRAPAPEIAEVCWRCSLRSGCLTWALDNEAPDGEAGVWGGTTPYQRRQLKVASLERVHCPACLSTAVLSHGRGEVCLSCGMSWNV